MRSDIKVGQVVVLPALPRAGRWESVRVVVERMGLDDEYVFVRIKDETWLTEFHVDEVAVLGVNLTKEDI